MKYAKHSVVLLLLLIKTQFIFSQINLPFNLKDSMVYKNQSPFTGIEIYKNPDSKKSNFDHDYEPTFYEYYFSEGINVKVIGRYGDYNKTRTEEFPICFTINFNPNTHTIIDSIVYRYYPNSKLYQRIPLLNGKIDGCIFQYNEYGDLHLILSYQNDVKFGPAIKFENNKVVAIYEDGSGQYNSRVAEYYYWGIRKRECYYHDNGSQNPIKDRCFEYDENGKTLK